MARDKTGTSDTTTDNAPSDTTAEIIGAADAAYDPLASDINQGRVLFDTTASATDKAKAGETLLQDVIDFLHWMFPAHNNLPGTSRTQAASQAASQATADAPSAAPSAAPR